MKAVRIANLQAVAFPELITIVRGDTSFSIRRSEITDLITILGELSTDMQAEPSTTVEVETLNVSHIPSYLDPELSTSPTRIHGRSTRQLSAWVVVRRFLSSCDRAQGFKSLVRHVRRTKVVEGNVGRTLDTLLQEKVSAGELILTNSGRYRLPNI